MITVSLVILTWNRWPSVSASLAANIASAGYPIRELIHVDNGSELGFCDKFVTCFNPDTQLRHRLNLGVAKGYNRGLALATSSHVAITGCDRIMPDLWLRDWVNVLERVPNVGALSCYSIKAPERIRGTKGVETINGVRLQRSIPVEARIHSKAFLFETGFWREDFGSYGYEDAEWADRAEKTALRLGLTNYMLADQPLAKELSDSDGTPVNGENYTKYKHSEHSDPRRKALWRKCHDIGSPHYNPYARVEPDLLGDKE